MPYVNYYFIRLSAATLTVFVVTGALYNPLFIIFAHNFILNSIIFSTIVFGITLCFLNLYKIKKEQDWFDNYDLGQERFQDTSSPKILAPLSIILGSSKKTVFLSPMSVRSLLTSIETRLADLREISRYITGLLIFLGLLGTFWGLSQTVGSIAGVITGIDVNGPNVAQAFEKLKRGLQSPLVGMGTAFSSSMFGLAGSLVIGFMDLQVSKASSIFYHIVEEKLTSLIKTKCDDSEFAHSGPAYTKSLLEQTTENLDHLCNLVCRSEDNRINVIRAIQSLSEKLSLLSEQILTQQAFIKRTAQNQIEFQENLQHFSQIMANPVVDEGLKHHLRSVDITLTKLLEETVEGRNRVIQDLRNEIRLVARTISSLSNQEIVA